jgi:uncharacterized protein DUF397
MNTAEALHCSPELNWFKSSYSSNEGGECVEVAVSWFKSSYSSGEGGACVEVANCPGMVHLRDSKDKAGPQLAFSTAGWSAFVGYVSAAS